VQLDVRLKGMTLGRALREQIVDHLDAAFRRLSKRIRAVTVCLADANGPRGGVDKNCQIAVQLHRGGTVRSSRTDADLIAAVNLAADRVTHAVVRRLERRRMRAARTKSWTPCED
jgi:putative sigma-54 modulation protein